MICLKICTFVVSATTSHVRILLRTLLWFAWKFVPLWYQQQQPTIRLIMATCCDLLENLYLCGISNNNCSSIYHYFIVVICLKICTFVVSATTREYPSPLNTLLWFAWKFVPLWYQQQPSNAGKISLHGCDLLENLYLCGISNNA